MAVPTATPDLNPLIGGAFEEFNTEANEAGFIAHLVAPIVEVALQAANPGKLPIEALLQSRDTLRGPGAPYARDNFEFAKFAYACEEYGKETPIDHRQRQMYRNLIDLEMTATRRSRHDVLNHVERVAAAAMFNTSTWTGASLTTAVTNEWDDAANATPVDDVEAAREKVISGSGLDPNALIINRAVYRNLRKVAQILDRIKGGASASDPASVTPQALAEIFDLPFIIVAGGLKNTADEGQSASISRIWSGEYAMLARVAVTNDPQEPCVARTFHWSEDGSLPFGAVEMYEEQQSRSTIVRVRHDADFVVMYPEAAHLLSNITT